MSEVVSSKQAPARIVSATPLHYAEAYPGEDMPSYVRGGSSLRVWQERLMIVQDDISALAMVEPAPPHTTRALLLPRGHANRRTFGSSIGNKPHKLDLEASIVLPDGRYVAFGSGSSELRPREVIVVVEPSLSYRMIDAKALYARWRENQAFAGKDLNLEGALVVDDEIWFFQRGNSVQSDNAIGSMRLQDFVRYLDDGALPAFLHVEAFPLGEVRGVPWGTTDAAQTPEGELFGLAAAEDTDNPYDDGDILGSILVRLEGRKLPGLRYHTLPIVDLDGKPTQRKIEGIDYQRGGTDAPLRFWAVTDEDDEEAVSELLVIEVP